MLAALFLAKNSRGAATLLRPACVRYVQSSGGAKDPAHPEPVPLPKLKDSFLDGTSSTYLEELEERYRRDPGSVDRTWASFFKSLGKGWYWGQERGGRWAVASRMQTVYQRAFTNVHIQPHITPPTDTGVPAEAIAEAYDAFEKGSTTSPFTTAALSQQTAQESMKLLQLVRAYEVMGHFHAQLDPLGLDKRKKLPELDPAYYGFTDADMDREYVFACVGGNMSTLHCTCLHFLVYMPPLFGVCVSMCAWQPHDCTCIHAHTLLPIYTTYAHYMLPPYKIKPPPTIHHLLHPRHITYPPPHTRTKTHTPSTHNRFFLGTFGLSGFLSDQRPTRTLREVLRRLQETYCGTIGFEVCRGIGVCWGIGVVVKLRCVGMWGVYKQWRLPCYWLLHGSCSTPLPPHSPPPTSFSPPQYMQYMHIPDRDRCNWLRDRIETIEKVEFTKEKKLHTLDRLAWSEMFESFLANKYTAAKRFGLEGGESLIPGMKALIDRAADLGVECVVLGMPHRGRLNVLGNVVRKPLAQIFGEFRGEQPDRGEASWFGTGDVKYHLGTSYDRPTISGKRVHLSLLANPSHLEAVNTVVLGKVCVFFVCVGGVLGVCWALCVGGVGRCVFGVMEKWWGVFEGGGGCGMCTHVCVRVRTGVYMRMHMLVYVGIS